MTTYEQIINEPWPYKYANGANGEEAYDGACPCCLITGRGFDIKVSCWRVNPGFVSIDVAGTLPADKLRLLGKHVAENNGWSRYANWRVSWSNAVGPINTGGISP